MGEEIRMKRVRHIATSWSGARAVVGAFERRVAVWDVVARRKISEFDSVLDFGGRRLAITSDGERVIAGAYLRYGVACYNASSGKLLWQRKDRKKVQNISLAADDELVYCGFEGSAGHALDTITGETVERMRGVDDVHASSFEPLLFKDMKSRSAELLLDGQSRLGKIERATFAFLGCAFAPGLVVTSESGGPLRCFRTGDVVEMWRLHAPHGSHALELGFDEAAGLFEAIMWPFISGGQHSLCRIDPATGDLKATLVLPDSPVYGFCCKGSRLLTWDGSVLNTSSAELMGKLDFPDVTLV